MFNDVECDPRPDAITPGEPRRGELDSVFCLKRFPRWNRLLKLALPVVDVESRPSCPWGGVGGGSSSDLPPTEPMVEERFRSPTFAGGAKECEDRAERAEFVESFLKRLGSAWDAPLTADESAECDEGCEG